MWLWYKYFELPLHFLTRAISLYISAPSVSRCMDQIKKRRYMKAMARTKQTTRRSTGHRGLPVAEDGPVVDNPELNDVETEKLKEIEEGSMRAELKHIDKKFTEQGQTYYAETVEEDIPEQVNWWSKFALCLVRHMGGDAKRPYVQKISLQVNSQHLKDILKKTIQDFPGVSFNTKDITVDKPFRVLFHYRRELEEAGKELDWSSDAAQHLELLLDFIDEEFKDTIEESENLVEQGMINYEHLWTIFRPGTTIYAPVFGQPRAFTLNNYSYSCNPPGLALGMDYVDFDGDDMGTRSSSRLVPAFSGSQKISDLSAFPMEWHPAKEEVKQQLITRGRQWEQLAGMHFRQYKGIALDYTGDCGIQRYNIDGRVVIDTKTYHRLNAGTCIDPRPLYRRGEPDCRPRTVYRQSINILLLETLFRERPANLLTSYLQVLHSQSMLSSLRKIRGPKSAESKTTTTIRPRRLTSSQKRDWRSTH